MLKEGASFERAVVTFGGGGVTFEIQRLLKTTNICTRYNCEVCEYIYIVLGQANPALADLNKRPLHG